MDLKRFEGLKSFLPAAQLLLVPMNKTERDASYNGA